MEHVHGLGRPPPRRGADLRHADPGPRRSLAWLALVLRPGRVFDGRLRLCSLGPCRSRLVRIVQLHRTAPRRSNHHRSNKHRPGSPAPTRFWAANGCSDLGPMAGPPWRIVFCPAFPQLGRRRASGAEPSRRRAPFDLPRGCRGQRWRSRDRPAGLERRLRLGQACAGGPHRANQPPRHGPTRAPTWTSWYPCFRRWYLQPPERLPTSRRCTGSRLHGVARRPLLVGV